MTRRLLFCILSFATALIAAAPAHAGLSTWTSLSGLTTAAGADHVREYTRGTPPTTIYAATEDDGVFRSTNAGASWSAFNSGLTEIPGAKNVRTVFADGSRMLAGTSAGLFASTGGGAWQPLAQGPEDNPAQPKKLNTAVQALYSVTGGPLLAGGFSSGVFRSNDGGNTWIHPAPGNGMPAATTVWHLTSFVPGVVFAATSSGIFRSLDAGASWTLTSDGIPGTTLRVFKDPVNPLIYYAGTTAGVYRTVNGGLTWSAINGSQSKALLANTVRGMIVRSVGARTRIYAATENGLWVGTARNDSVLNPGPVDWRHVTESGLGGHDIFWTISELDPVTGTFIAGTDGNGGYALTFQLPFNIVDPSISGTTKVGKELTANKGTWGGTEEIAFTYQWQRCTASNSGCSDISGAEQDKYTLTAADFDKWIRVEVTAENDVNTFIPTDETSATVGKVGAADGDLPGANQSPAPSISGPGLPQSGHTLTATGASFNPSATLGITYLWYRCATTVESTCVLVPGVTGVNYVLSDTDVERRIRVKAVGKNAFGSKTTEFSGPSNEIFPKQATVKGGKNPFLEGATVVGESLIANVGEWEFPGTTWERVWIRCDADGSSCETLTNQKGPSYLLTAADAGKRLKAEIKADSNGPNKFPGPVFVQTPLSGVVTTPPVAAAPGGGEVPGAGQQQQSVAPPPPPDTTKPVLAALSLTSAKVKAGGTLTIAYRPTESSSLRVQVQRLTKGRRVGKACKTGRKKGKRCTIAKTVLTKTYPAATGATKVKLTLRAGGKKLPAGSYRLVITPVDGAGNRGAARTVAFKITRR